MGRSESSITRSWSLHCSWTITLSPPQGCGEAKVPYNKVLVTPLQLDNNLVPPRDMGRSDPYNLPVRLVEQLMADDVELMERESNCICKRLNRTYQRFLAHISQSKPFPLPIIVLGGWVVGGWTHLHIP